MSHKLVFINRKLVLLIKILVFSPKKTSFFTKRTLRARGKINLFLWKLLCDRTALPPSKPTATTIPIREAHDIAWNATLGVQQLSLPPCCNAVFLPEIGGIAVSWPELHPGNFDVALDSSPPAHGPAILCCSSALKMPNEGVKKCMWSWAGLHIRAHLFDLISISCSPGCLDPDVAKKTVPEQSKRIITLWLWLYDDLQLQTHIYLGDLPVPITFQPTYLVLQYRNSADQNKTHTHSNHWTHNNS